MNKIEAAERLAEAVEKCKHDFCADKWQLCWYALAAYRSASVPSDEELGRVAYEARMRGFVNTLEWGRTSQYDREAFARAAAAVRQWVQRDWLDDAEREVIVDAMRAYLVGEPKCEPARSILRKLGREPEPVWEWDEANATMTLGGKFSEGVFPCAAVSLFYGGGLLCRIYLSEMKELHQVLDNYAESLEWCEQQLREARQ